MQNGKNANSNVIPSQTFRKKTTTLHFKNILKFDIVSTDSDKHNLQIVSVKFLMLEFQKKSPANTGNPLCISNLPAADLYHRLPLFPFYC